MYLIVGLGNPGREYEHSRHNVGFMTVDLLADRLGVLINRSAHRALVAETRLNGQRIVLAKPQTYMNLSGMSVVDLMNWYKCQHSELVLVYDDIDLPVGSLRIREKGSAGTHNGMRSVIQQLGYDDFPRVRIGVGKAKVGWDLASHVLASPDEEERELLVSAMEKGADALEMIAADQLKEAQARFHERKRRMEPAEEQ